ncbi:hypothetical protein TRFO_18682 [Tritrichomonas foetus]|uniref:Uncharacterized protein n=1 Tax=Tritrichomonas foetus TaxID=1144522 RepID=A0A1J4KKX0_9EUKA|nr:hypothetical protein TRFO_18682 [Tritrichomonas foetus]|eukprot:OHT11786.1 hypothetical protein TRFO_18682 [Tritrichomonas foetus]
MTTVVFGIEILIHRIEFIQVESFPSLTIQVDKNEPQILLPYSKEAHPGDIWDEEKAYQLIYIIDAFESCVTYPFTLELVSPVETTALGKCTFELKPLICDAIAAHGCSPIASQTSFLRDFERREVACLTFDIRTVFFRMTQKRAATTNSQVKNMPRHSRYQALSIRNIPASEDGKDHGSMKASDSPSVSRSNMSHRASFDTRRRRDTQDPHAGTVVPRHRKAVSSVSNPLQSNFEFVSDFRQ